MRSDLLLLVLVVALVHSTLAYIARRGGRYGERDMVGFEYRGGSGSGVSGHGSDTGEDAHEGELCKPKKTADGSVKRMVNWPMEDACMVHLKEACMELILEDESSEDYSDTVVCEMVAGICAEHLMRASGAKRSELDGPKEEEKNEVCEALKKSGDKAGDDSNLGADHFYNFVSNDSFDSDDSFDSNDSFDSDGTDSSSSDDDDKRILGRLLEAAKRRLNRFH